MAIDPAAQAAAPDPAAAPAAPDMSKGFCVEICKLPDGTYTVSVEPLPEEALEQGEETQSVGNMAEALKLAREILMHDGSMGDANAGADEMNAAYSKDSTQ